MDEYGESWLGCGEMFLMQASSIVRSVLSVGVDRPGDFRPMSNCFEIFGFDFVPKRIEKVVEDDGDADGAAQCSEPPFQLQLLEVNGGPALEGVARPDLCVNIVEDVMKMVIDPFLKKCYAGVAEKEEGGDDKKGEVLQHGTEFVKVWERGRERIVGGEQPYSVCFQTPLLASDKLVAFGRRLVQHLRDAPESSEEEEDV